MYMCSQVEAQWSLASSEGMITKVQLGARRILGSDPPPSA